VELPFSAFEILRRLFPRLAATLVVGFAALFMVSPDTGTRAVDWAIRAEAAHLTKRIKPIIEAPFAATERNEAEAFLKEQRSAHARALARARKAR
jgi:hypothetical protein